MVTTTSAAGVVVTGAVSERVGTNVLSPVALTVLEKVPVAVPVLAVKVMVSTPVGAMSQMPQAGVALP